MKRRKKRFVLPLCLLLLLSLCAPAYAAADAPFADIHGHWAECQMTWAQEAGILTGTSSTTLSPDDTATRAMAVTVLYRYAGSPAVEGTSGFADVPADAYYADGVAWCVQAGLITGKTETAFRPGDPMTREEFAATLYRLLVDRHGVPEQVGENNVTTLADFADAQSVSAFAQDAMAWAVGDLFLSGGGKPGPAVPLLSGGRALHPSSAGQRPPGNDNRPGGDPAVFREGKRLHVHRPGKSPACRRLLLLCGPPPDRRDLGLPSPFPKRDRPSLHRARLGGRCVFPIGLDGELWSA